MPDDSRHTQNQWIMETTEKRKTFAELIRSDRPVLVDFYTEWCGPCKMMKPVLEKLKADLGNKLKIIKVDVDRNNQVALHYQIQGVPTFILFRNGQILWRQSGALPLAVLKQAVESHL